MSKVKIDKDKLLLHFISEAYCIEHWLIQAELSKDITALMKRMNKRLTWVENEIKKLEDAKN